MSVQPDEATWRAHVRAQNNDYEFYDRNCDADSLNYKSKAHGGAAVHPLVPGFGQHPLGGGIGAVVSGAPGGTIVQPSADHDTSSTKKSKSKKEKKEKKEKVTKITTLIGAAANNSKPKSAELTSGEENNKQGRDRDLVVCGAEINEQGQDVVSKKTGGNYTSSNDATSPRSAQNNGIAVDGANGELQSSKSSPEDSASSPELMQTNTKEQFYANQENADSSTSLQDQQQQAPAAWIAELEWRQLLITTREMVIDWAEQKGTKEVKMPVSKYEEQYAKLTNGKVLKFPMFDGEVTDLYSLHEALAEEKGFMSYVKNWEYMLIPKDDTKWQSRLQKDPLFYIIEQEARVNSEIKQILEEKQQLFKEKQLNEKKQQDLKKNVDSCKKAYMLQRGEQNREQLRKQEDKYNEAGAEIQRVVLEMRNLDTKIRLLEKEKKQIVRYRSVEEVTKEKEERKNNMVEEKKTSTDLVNAFTALVMVEEEKGENEENRRGARTTAAQMKKLAPAPKPVPAKEPKKKKEEHQYEYHKDQQYEYNYKPQKKSSKHQSNKPTSEVAAVTAAEEDDFM
ncbi:unnamed protein product [Amoebophrya sp. A120]|nr:unnamed protein product [Amoebophrya sp. A120]|eukprot:GSA120T00014476001.1